MSNPVRSLGYIKCYSSSSPRPVKSSSNSIRYNCQKICSWSRRPKTILKDWKSEKRPHFSRWSMILFNKFFKNFTNHRKKTNGPVVFSCRPFPKILKYRTTDETFQQSGKQDSFRHILKSSGSMDKILGSPFLRTTTGMQSGRITFDESRFSKPSWELQTFYAISEV